MNKRIFRSILLVAGVVLLASFLIILDCLYGYFENLQEGQLRDELSLAVSAVEEEGESYLSRLKPESYRLTWVGEDGGVLYDTQADAGQMENHKDRTEIQDALKLGQGQSSRYSSTLMEKTLYFAHRMKDGSVLRISVSRATAWRLVLGMLQPVLMVLAAALLLSGLLAGRLSKKIVEPLNHLDLEHPLDNECYEEISPLLNRINRQHEEIQQQLRVMRQRTDEFNQIIGNMQEGLVLLDEKEIVLSINAAALKLFGAEEGCVGRSFLTVDRSHEVGQAIQQSLSDGHAEIRCHRGGRVYQFDLSRIASDGRVVGAVLLAFDITEQEYAERNRREFTANVSHELKTPLQGILGSAELIEKGMVQPEDVPHFIGQIRTEATRMVTLIGDIIRLSQLDEGDEMLREKVELFALAEEVTDSLKDEAAKKKVTLVVEGQAASIEGVRRLLYEIFYNLCDNAIKYNVPGGSVHFFVDSNEKSAVVKVADTGIGIPAEDQSRVFERFYRVDKSHSKASGGTGLGLSIVKHAVQYHHGTIELKSEPGKGTEITCVFPK